jgi:hypothetical protein
MAHGAARGQGILNGRGNGPGMAKGHGNALASAFGHAISLVTSAFGRGNAPGKANSRGNSVARGRGFGHASVGNPGHNALSTRSSHSKNPSHKDGSQLISDLPANHAEELKPDTTYSGHDRYVFPNLIFSPELEADRGERSDPDAVASDLNVTVTRKLASPPG